MYTRSRSPLFRRDEGDFDVSVNSRYIPSAPVLGTTERITSPRSSSSSNKGTSKWARNPLQLRRPRDSSQVTVLYSIVELNIVETRLMIAFPWDRHGLSTSKFSPRGNLEDCFDRTWLPYIYICVCVRPCVCVGVWTVRTSGFGTLWERSLQETGYALGLGQRTPIALCLDQRPSKGPVPFRSSTAASWTVRYRCFFK